MKKNKSLKNKKYVLAISFANYIVDKSGMPKVMLSHQLLFNKEDVSYVSLFSVKKNILKDKYMLFCYFGMVIDGEFVGIFSINQILKMIYDWNKEGFRILGIHIHHLLYVKLKHIEKLFNKLQNVPIKVFLHDYYYACTKYNLMYNNEVYCGGNGLNHQSCKGCQYFENSLKTEKVIHQIFKQHKDRITFISPSEVTKSIFLKFHPEYKNQTIVIPHQILKGENKENLELIGENEKIRIAFLGMPARHKGWNAWQKLVDTLPHDKYEFYVFNSSNDEYENMKKVHVQFDKSNLNSMIDALCKNKIHVAFLWAIWPETYSYTCFESFSANAFIITNQYSGNITDVIKKYDNGVILSDNYCEILGDYSKLRETINSYRVKSNGGPLELLDNDEIVSMTYKEEIECLINDQAMIVLPSFICWLLEKIYMKK